MDTTEEAMQSVRLLRTILFNNKKFLQITGKCRVDRFTVKLAVRVALKNHWESALSLIDTKSSFGSELRRMLGYMIRSDYF